MLDPAFGSDGETFRVSRQIFEGLLGNELGGTEPVPELAEDWEVSEDGLEYTFTLQRGREVPRRHGLQRRGGLLQLRPLVQLRGPGPEPERLVLLPGGLRRLRQTRRTPRASTRAARRPTRTPPSSGSTQVTVEVPRGPGAAVVLDPEPRRRWRSTTRTTCPAARTRSTYSEYALEHPVGTGPFKFESWDRGNGEVTIVRNDDYWGEAAQARRDHLPDDPRREHPPPGARRPARSTATTSSPRPTTRRLEDDGFQVLVRDPFNILYLGINGGNVPDTGANPALKDPQVRQAIAHAIDRETIVSSLLPDGAEAATQFMPPTVDGWADDVTTYDYDPERAKQLLAEAGATGTDAAVLLPDRRQPAVPAGPGRDVPGDQPEPDRRRLHHRADGAAVEPGLPATPSRPVRPTSTCSGGPVTTTTPTTSSARSSPRRRTTRRRPSSVRSARRRSSPRWPRPTRSPTRPTGTELYQEANRLIMDYLPGVPISHSPPALVVARERAGSRAQPADRRGLLDGVAQRLIRFAPTAPVAGSCHRRRGRPLRRPERLT